jgi:hypothetical protein
MGIATFTAQSNSYLYPPGALPGGPLSQEQGATLILEWDRQKGVEQQTSAVTSFKWMLPTETWHLNGSGTVIQNGYNFDFVAWVGPQPITLYGKLAVSFPIPAERLGERLEERLAALAAIYEGEGLSALVAFGKVTGDLSGIAPF